MKRLFIAVDLSIAVVEKLAILQEDLQRQFSSRVGDGLNVRWVEAPNIHLTLKFLGETEDALLPMIAQKLEKLGQPLFPFEVECQGVGFFPDISRPRILWAGMDTRGGEVLGLLQQAVERDLEELGIAEETREFLPHITLGRVRTTKAVDVSETIERFSDMRFGKSYIKDIVLYESRLEHRGPRYIVLERFPLGNT